MKNQIRWTLYRLLDRFIVGRCNNPLRVALLRLGWPWEPRHVSDPKLGACRVRFLRPTYFMVQAVKAAMDRFLYRWSPTQRYQLARELNKKLADTPAPIHARVGVWWFPLRGIFVKQ